MKAILVTDMPKGCCECNMAIDLCHGTIPSQEWYEKRPTWCPLKPMPLKRETMVHWKSIGGGDIPTHEISDYDKGWNDCIDFLEGDMQDD